MIVEVRSSCVATLFDFVAVVWFGCIVLPFWKADPVLLPLALSWRLPELGLRVWGEAI